MELKANNLAELVGVRTQTNVSDQLFHQISDLILSGKLEEGYVFPNETVLCEQLQVGRTTLREAYKALELSGYVTRTKRGTSVNSRSSILNATPLKSIFSSADPKDFNEFRIMLEAQSAYLAACNVGLAETEMLERLIEQTVEARARGDYDSMIELDVKFHQSIAKFSKNALIEIVVDVMTEAWNESIRRNFSAAQETNPEIFDMMLTQHSDITKSIRIRDGAAAKAAMEKHIRSVTSN